VCWRIIFCGIAGRWAGRSVGRTSVSVIRRAARWRVTAGRNLSYDLCRISCVRDLESAKWDHSGPRFHCISYTRLAIYRLSVELSDFARRLFGRRGMSGERPKELASEAHAKTPTVRLTLAQHQKWVYRRRSKLPCGCSSRIEPFCEGFLPRADESASISDGFATNILAKHLAMKFWPTWRICASHWTLTSTFLTSKQALPG
jgi:hypothetical protein